MYAEALNENERLKSRLQDSKQELAKIRSQLEKVTQVKEEIKKANTPQIRTITKNFLNAPMSPLEARQTIRKILGTRFGEKGEFPQIFSLISILSFFRLLTLVFCFFFPSSFPVISRTNTRLRRECQTWRTS